MEIVGRTRDWLRYEVPMHFVRKESRGHYRGQKQIWFLLRMLGRDCDMNIRATNHPEFDAWRWNEYWVPLEAVIEFKRGVYEMALTELARFLPRPLPNNRFLRTGLRGARQEVPVWPPGADGDGSASDPASAQDEVGAVDQLGFVRVADQAGNP